MSALESSRRRRRPSGSPALGRTARPSAVDRSRQRLLEALDELLRTGATPTRAALSQRSGLPRGYVSWALDGLQPGAVAAEGTAR